MEGKESQKAIRFLKRQISQANNKTKDVDSLSVYALKYYLDELEEEFSQLRNYFSSLEVEDDKIAEVDREYEKYEDLYVNTKARIMGSLDKRSEKNANQSVLTGSAADGSILNVLEKQNEIFDRLTTAEGRDSSRLPVLKIPIFDGDFKNWTKFKNLFTNIVHKNVKLSDVEKLNHLMSLLGGEASSLVNHYDIIGTNYAHAWEDLTEKYEKPFLITRSYINNLVSLPSIENKKCSVGNLCNILKETINSLNNMGKYGQSRDPWIIYLVTSKFDFEVAKDWAEKVCDKDQPTLDSLIDFLTDKTNAMELMSELSTIKLNKRPITNFSTLIGGCFVCTENHKIFQCNKFKSLSVAEREILVKQKSRCINCLGKGHNSFQCYSRRLCTVCEKKHHTMLHRTENSADMSERVKGSNEGSGSGLTRINHTFSRYFDRSLLPTALVHVHDGNGKLIKCRILLDSGSQACFVSERFFHKLSIKKHNSKIPVQVIAKRNPIYSRGMISVVIESIYSPEFKITASLHILSEFVMALPSEDRNFVCSEELREKFLLADPNFFESSDVDMILGSHHFFEILGRGKYFHSSDNVWIQETNLGWIIAGGNQDAESESYSVNCSMVACDSGDLNDLIERFWKLEEPEVIVAVPPDAEYCEDHYLRSTIRLESGRYSVSLPFRDPLPVLGESRQLALRRYFGLERKFEQNVGFKENYYRILNEFVSNNYIERVPNEELMLPISQRFYFPHYGVTRDFDGGSKIRIVFDASMRSDNGVSLNDLLLTGPNLQRELSSLIIDIRLRKYIFSADISKMYRQILVNKDYIDYQRFFWRDDPKGEVHEWRILTVTDGESVSPFLALRTMQQLAKDEYEKFPIGSKILGDRYMDDFFIGDDNISHLIIKRDQLIGILATAGMSLSKWSSNDARLLHGIRTEDLSQSECFDFGNDNLVKTLGISWNCAGDYFTFKCNLNKSECVTKRALIANTCRIFDPLGWISPYVVLWKILFQETWIKKVGWDERLPEDMLNKINKLQESSADLGLVRIDRHIGLYGSIEIHGFCDASSKAFAACVYLRGYDPHGNISTKLIAAKSRLAPIKSISIARLELCGAHLLSRLIRSIRPSFATMEPTYHCWTDSKTVISWLSSHPSRWKSFVANRCSHIHELVPDVPWNYVKTEKNPADMATRGLMINELSNRSLWWDGPLWLKSEAVSDRESIPDTIEELRPGVCGVMICDKDVYWSRFLSRFSSAGRLHRGFAYICRYVHNSRVTEFKLTGELTVSEMSNSNLQLLKGIQFWKLSEIINSVKNGNELPPSSGLSKLSLFLDDKNLLRVGGRLMNIDIEYSRKHPIFLPKCDYVPLLIDEVHIRYYHASVNFVLSVLRQRFWIPGIRSMIKNRLRKCIDCQRYNNKSFQPRMGQIPKFRLDFIKPFDVCGIDFAGPFVVRPYKGRGNISIKSYIAVIVCMSTRALHLELVYDLSSDSLILALKRFIARRERVNKLYSDNGRNFVGCDKIIKETNKHFREFVEDSSVREYLLNNLMEWSFIPPYSPHFGGIWESAVRSIKRHLIRVFFQNTMTAQEFVTVITEIESILNSRPISPLSDDPDDFEIISPSHLLTGFPLVEFEIGTESSKNIFSVSVEGVKKVQATIKSFWTKWRNEFLQRCYLKSKWRKPGRVPCVNDLVLIKRNWDTPKYWSKGRILKLHPGADGEVRVVDVRTMNGIHRESTRNLIPLDLKQDASTGGE